MKIGGGSSVARISGRSRRSRARRRWFRARRTVSCLAASRPTRWRRPSLSRDSVRAASARRASSSGASASRSARRACDHQRSGSARGVPGASRPKAFTIRIQDGRAERASVKRATRRAREGGFSRSPDILHDLPRRASRRHGSDRRRTSNVGQGARRLPTSDGAHRTAAGYPRRLQGRPMARIGAVGRTARSAPRRPAARPRSGARVRSRRP